MILEDLGYNIELEDYVQQNNLSGATFDPDDLPAGGCQDFRPDGQECG